MFPVSIGGGEESRNNEEEEKDLVHIKTEQEDIVDQTNDEAGPSQEYVYIINKLLINYYIHIYCINRTLIDEEDLLKKGMCVYMNI